MSSCVFFHQWSTPLAKLTYRQLIVVIVHKVHRVFSFHNRQFLMVKGWWCCAHSNNVSTEAWWPGFKTQHNSIFGSHGLWQAHHELSAQRSVWTTLTPTAAATLTHHMAKSKIKRPVQSIYRHQTLNLSLHRRTPHQHHCQHHRPLPSPSLPSYWPITCLIGPGSFSAIIMCYFHPSAFGKSPWRQNAHWPARQVSPPPPPPPHGAELPGYGGLLLM